MKISIIITGILNEEGGYERVGSSEISREISREREMIGRCMSRKIK